MILFDPPAPCTVSPVFLGAGPSEVNRGLEGFPQGAPHVGALRVELAKGPGERREAHLEVALQTHKNGRNGGRGDNLFWGSQGLKAHTGKRD